MAGGAADRACAPGPRPKATGYPLGTQQEELKCQALLGPLSRGVTRIRSDLRPQAGE